MARAMLTLLLLIAFPCDAEFVRVTHVQQPYNFTLKRASALGIAHHGTAHNWTASRLANFALSADFHFDSLDQTSFEKLATVYGGWSKTKSAVTFKAGMKYTLLDFLPPVMQAAFGLHFTTQYHNFSLPSFVAGAESKQVSQKSTLAVNCWAFAYDVLVSAGTTRARMTIAVGDPGRAWRVLTGLSSMHLQSSLDTPAVLTDGKVRNAKLQPGDYILIWHQNPNQPLSLDHIAIFIDDDLYYEKAGSGDNTPFRLVSWEGLTADWVPFVFNWRWQRGLAPFASGQSTFGLQNTESVGQFPLFAELKEEVALDFCMAPDRDADNKVLTNAYLWSKPLPPFVLDRIGRAQFSGTVFKPEGLLIDVPTDIYQH